MRVYVCASRLPGDGLVKTPANRQQRLAQKASSVSLLTHSATPYNADTRARRWSGVETVCCSSDVRCEP